MHQKIFILLCGFFSWVNLVAFEPEPEKWYDFEGQIATFDILLSIYLDEQDSITGYYCYKKYETRISLKGTLENGEVCLTEYVQGKKNGYFTGQFSAGDRDILSGNWINADKSKEFPFSLNLLSVVSGQKEKRYPEYFGPDIKVEEFMQKVKTSVLKGDKEWLATHTRYPISVDLDGKDRTTIRNKKDFLLQYKRIFHPQYKEKLQKARVWNLFYNYQGIMLGNGEIWIDLKSEQAEDSYEFEIIAINN